MSPDFPYYSISIVKNDVMTASRPNSVHSFYRAL